MSIFYIKQVFYCKVLKTEKFAYIYQQVARLSPENLINSQHDVDLELYANVCVHGKT